MSEEAFRNDRSVHFHSERLSMADFHYRHPKTAPGRFYTDVLCLDCFVCREALPAVFVLDEAKHTTYVSRQPSTKAEVAICEDCLNRCPCDAIGDDGDTQDWTVRSFYSSVPESEDRVVGDRCRIERAHSEEPKSEH
jgi:ferredoxin